MTEQPVAAQPAADAEAQQGGGGWGTTIFRWVMMYYCINFFMTKWRGDSNKPIPQTNPDGTINEIPVSQFPHSPLWKPNSPYNLRIYLSENDDLFNMLLDDNLDDYLVYQQNHVQYSCDTESFFEKDINVTLSKELQNNGSYYAHIIMSHFGYPIIEEDEDFDKTKVVYHTHPLVSYRKQRGKKKQNLLFGAETDKETESEPETEIETEVESESETKIISYWKPVLTLRPLCDWTTYKANAIPSQISSHYNIDLLSNKYYPVLYMDDFWLLGDHLIALNDTLNTVPLKISHSPISQWKFMLQSQMEQQYEYQSAWGMSSTEDNDEVRRLLMESNPYLLGVTMIVTLFHTVFDFLAFKNDIQFWSKTESVEGLSVRTIFINCFCQLIIFLYLLDQDTTWMILISSGIGFIIECWKITQAAKVSVSSKFPFILIEDKETYSESDTKRHDKQAMKYLSYAAYPLLFGYTIYSILYNEHRGWYSFVIGTLVSFIYMFGFIMMCPQLYLNYKLKSTAHLPWRMMTYKFLNTIIDDLFAFLIKMPTMHRISCFRDDAIFLIFLYQKWIYPTDYTRVNEYGFKRKDNVAIDNDDKNTINAPTDDILDDDKDKDNANDDIDLDDNVVDDITKKNN